MPFELNEEEFDVQPSFGPNDDDDATYTADVLPSLTESQHDESTKAVPPKSMDETSKIGGFEYHMYLLGFLVLGMAVLMALARKNACPVEENETLRLTLDYAIEELAISTLPISPSPTVSVSTTA